MDEGKERTSNRQARERLHFLHEHGIQKGRGELLIQLYRREIHELSLVGASKVISQDLGIPVGVQTIRTLRVKQSKQEKGFGTGGGRVESTVEPLPSPGNSLEQAGLPDGLNGFKPLDVFADENQIKPNLIRWAAPKKS
ncbi:hypothetical protein [Telluribacter humicola]|uniref:hypothetical protein n=1 Tax=Telluribacter humicola TaxID=1720261 RepID=UPI001A95A965|nr:hypothetical protein [Telluribacter humicola]